MIIEAKRCVLNCWGITLSGLASEIQPVATGLESQIYFDDRIIAQFSDKSENSIVNHQNATNRS